jgi:hypothetical protein
MLGYSRIEQLENAPEYGASTQPRAAVMEHRVS